MSSLATLARPYAKAAFSLAQESGRLAEWQSMLSLAADMVTDSQVAEVLTNPLVSAAQGVDLINAAGGDNFDQAFSAFLEALAHNRRLQLLPEVLGGFVELKRAAEKTLSVRVVSAVPLDADQQSRIGAALSKRFDCEVELQPEIDPSVLGGAVIYAGDQVIDGSLRGRLNKLSNALSR